jgi:hypothetical protein
MGLKKHLTTFVSNWLGVILASIIVFVSATFGGMYLYARSRVDNTINFITQVITLRYPDGLTLVESVDNLPPYIYHLVLQVYNPYADTIDASITDVSITLDTYELTVVEDGSWSKSIPTGYTTQTFTDLAAKGKVDVDIKGTISGSGQYKWIKRQNQRSFNILIHGVLFQLNPVSSSNVTAS